MKTILITGSTDGIGKLAAAKLAKNGNQILVHGRNSEKLHQTVAEIKEATANTNIEGFIADLSNFESIKKMIPALFEKTSKIDVLINNAGVFKSSIQQNKEGLDLRFAVNYFAPYLLTNGLLPLLQKSSAPRVINLSSAAQATVSIDALTGKQSLTQQDAYAQSKLALTMWSLYLSQKLDFLNVIAVNPGSLLNTRMVQEAYGQFWSSADKGANILYDLALSDEYKECTGRYFDNDKGYFSEAHRDVYKPEKIKGLLTATEKFITN